MTSPAAVHGSRHAVGLGDLLRALHATQPAEWPWVAAAHGWPDAARAERARLARARQEARPPAPDRDADRRPPALPPAAPLQPPPPPPAQQRPQQTFWRVASDLIDPAARTEAPDWLDQPATAAAADFESDAAARPPALVPLVRPGQAASFLRRHLARQRPAAGIDLARVLRALVRQRPLLQVPRRLQSRWPARLQLVYDAQPALGPLHEDLRELADQIARRLGPRLELFVVAGLSGRWTDAKGQSVPAPAAGAATLVLGDAGLMQAEAVHAARWCAFARHGAAAGFRPLLLAPVPRRLARRDTASAFDTVLLGAGRAMRTVRAARLPANPGADDAAPRLPARRDGTAGGGPPAQPLAPDLAPLRAAIYGNPWVTPALLRVLRLTLQAHGHALDVASEADLWQDPGVSANELACTLQPDQHDKAAADFGKLPKPLRDALVALHWQHLLAGSPLLRAEYARALRPVLAGEPAGDAARGCIEAGVDAATELSRRACQVLARQPGALAQDLAGYVGRLGQRRPEQVAGDDEALQAAWALAHRQALAEGRIAPLPGLDSARVAWALARDDADTRRFALALQGLPRQGGAAPPRWELRMHEAAAAAPAPPGALLGNLASRWTQVRPAAAQADAGIDHWLAADRPLLLDASQAVELRNAARISVIEPFTRPGWARAIRFESGDWQALAPDGRWLSWRPRFRYASGADRLADAGAWLPPAGAWVSEREGCVPDRFDGAILERPQWAGAHGVDAQGPWAEVTVSGRHGTATQRLRWIPPGEFWMGSPASEPERRDDEARHGVVLTQGFWLADTACTQALWQAVLGENPSRFQDDPGNPVERVSWNGISERFLPELNRCVPGLEAGLPTEAQWEYACRAGSETPFCFGEQITTEQVNHNGNLPYNNGPPGEYRARSVPVKTLPANGWGLYQMHGNVWEWCLDEYDAYPNGPVVDPKDHRLLDEQGSAAVGRRRVLRGGGWSNYGRYCRSAQRNANGPDDRDDTFGFRLARGLAETVGPEAQAGGVAQRAEPAAALPRVERGAARWQPFRDTGTVGKKPKGKK